MKNILKYPDYPLVMITWTDAANINDNWHPLETDYTIPATCVSVGYLVGDHKKVKTLYAHIALEDERTNACGKGNMMIPTTQIISIKKLKV